jgi:hypothetical protein
MRLASVDALATRQALNRNPSDALALVSCSASLESRLAKHDGRIASDGDDPLPATQPCDERINLNRVVSPANESDLAAGWSARNSLRGHTLDPEG